MRSMNKTKNGSFVVTDKTKIMEGLVRMLAVQWTVSWYGTSDWGSILTDCIAVMTKISANESARICQLTDRGKRK